MGNLEQIRFGSGEFSAGNSMTVSAYRTQVNFEIDEPWAGCTETGFGQKNNFDLNFEQAKQLRDFLNNVLPNE